MRDQSIIIELTQSYGGVIYLDIKDIKDIQPDGSGTEIKTINNNFIYVLEPYDCVLNFINQNKN